MQCKKCPHHVRHGQVAADKKTIEFKDRCGLLRAKEKSEQACNQYPFAKGFEYTTCDVYQNTFKSAGQRNDVVPTKDYQYGDAFNSASITEMELL